MQHNAAHEYEQRNFRIAVGSPVVIEGLRAFGCLVDATATTMEELPRLAARRVPSQVILAPAVWDTGVLLTVQRVRSMLPACDIVVLAPEDRIDDVRGRLFGIRATVVGAAAQPAVLRAALGLPEATALTRRELQVVELAARGLTNHAIARELGLRDDTVKNYLRAVYRKLGARSRTEAVVLALRAGYAVLRPR